MKLPNAENAVIEEAKLLKYLLSVERKKGRSKARFLARMGYTADNWQGLERDIREQLLHLDVDKVKETDYGTAYIIDGDLAGPMNITRIVRSVWMIEHGKENPRLITLYPKG